MFVLTERMQTFERVFHILRSYELFPSAFIFALLVYYPDEHSKPYRFCGGKLCSMNEWMHDCTRIVQHLCSSRDQQKPKKQQQQALFPIHLGVCVCVFSVNVNVRFLRCALILTFVHLYTYTYIHCKPFVIYLHEQKMFRIWVCACCVCIQFITLSHTLDGPRDARHTKEVKWQGRRK